VTREDVLYVQGWLLAGQPADALNRPPSNEELEEVVLLALVGLAAVDTEDASITVRRAARDELVLLIARYRASRARTMKVIPERGTIEITEGAQR